MTTPNDPFRNCQLCPSSCDEMPLARHFVSRLVRLRLPCVGFWGLSMSRVRCVGRCMGSPIWTLVGKCDCSLRGQGSAWAVPNLTACMLGRAKGRQCNSAWAALAEFGLLIWPPAVKRDRRGSEGCGERHRPGPRGLSCDSYIRFRFKMKGLPSSSCP